MREYVGDVDLIEHEWYIELDGKIIIFDGDDFYVMALLEAHQVAGKKFENAECVNIMAHNIARHIAITNKYREENEKLEKELNRLNGRNNELKETIKDNNTSYNSLLDKYSLLLAEKNSFEESNRNNYNLHIKADKEIELLKKKYDTDVNTNKRYEKLYNREIGLHAVTACKLDEKDSTIDKIVKEKDAIIDEKDATIDELVKEKEKLLDEKYRLLFEISSGEDDDAYLDDNYELTDADFKRYEGRKSKISDGLKENIARLRDNGNSFNEIVSLVGLSYSTIRCILDEAYRLREVHGGKGDTTNRINTGGRKALPINETRLKELFNEGLSYNNITKVLIEDGLKTATVPTIRNRCIKLGLKKITTY